MRNILASDIQVRALNSCSHQTDPPAILTSMNASSPFPPASCAARSRQEAALHLECCRVALLFPTHFYIPAKAHGQPLPPAALQTGLCSALDSSCAIQTTAHSHHPVHSSLVAQCRDWERGNAGAHWANFSRFSLLFSKGEALCHGSSTSHCAAAP